MTELVVATSPIVTLNLFQGISIYLNSNSETLPTSTRANLVVRNARQLLAQFFLEPRADLDAVVWP